MTYRVLVLLMLSACQGAHAPLVQGLPPIPDEIPSVMGWVPVVWVDSLTGADGEELMGGFHLLRRTIYLQTSLRPHRAIAWQVLFHEVCHVRLFDAGLRFALTPELEQQVCDGFGVARVYEMLSGFP